jgi:hypothetical protein
MKQEKALKILTVFIWRAASENYMNAESAMKIDLLPKLQGKK